MFNKITLAALSLALFGLISCAGVEKFHGGTRGVANKAGDVDGSMNDVERTESTIERLKKKFGK
jgi:hypothetical protein